MVIKNNVFTNNIGTFGGAISINSPNFAFGKLPFVAIRDNQFMNNMAYFSGNAIYIQEHNEKAKCCILCFWWYIYRE
jgi:hypothetical protein